MYFFSFVAWVFSVSTITFNCISNHSNIEVPLYIKFKQYFPSVGPFIQKGEIRVFFSGSTSQRPCCFQASLWTFCRPQWTGCIRWSHSCPRTSRCALGPQPRNELHGWPEGEGWDLGCTEGKAIETFTYVCLLGEEGNREEPGFRLVRGWLHVLCV